MADNMRDMTLNLIVNSQVGRIKDFNKNLKDTERSIDRTTKKTGWLSRNLGRIFITYFGIQGVKGMINTYRNLDLVRRSIEGLTKSTQDWDYIQREAFRTATDIEVVAKGYRNFYAAASMAGIDKGGIQTMYSEILEAGRAVGATQYQVNGALLALEQMFSKGKVSMEELRKQLGNALPGAFEVAAKSMGMTTQQFNEMIKKGIQAKDLVPKFTAEYRKTFMKSFPEAMKSLDAAIINLNNSWKLFQYDFGKSAASKEFAKVIVQISQILQSNELKMAITAVARLTNVLLNVLSFLLRHLKEILFIISPLIMGAAIDKLIKSVAILVGWIRAGNLALSVTQRWMLLIFAGIVMLDEVIALFQKGRKSVIKTVLFGEEGVSGAMRIVGALSMIGITLGGIWAYLKLIQTFKGFGNVLPKNGVPTPSSVGTEAGKGSLIDRINKANKAVDKEMATNARKVRMGRIIKSGKNVLSKSAPILGRLGEAGIFIGFLEHQRKNMLKAWDLSSQYDLKHSKIPSGFSRDYVMPNLSKTETFAPNITYNPQYHIDATGLTPEELVSVLDERDRNFWMSLNKGMPSVTSKGSGYSSLFPLSGGIR